MSTELEDDYDTRIPLPPGYQVGVNALVFSSTQFDTWDICKRKWWFRFWRKLPQPANAALQFGTTLHKVCERWLKADDQGRDPVTGKPVELYPDGWDALISPNEAALLRKLVAQAIHDGVLVRLPGREIEQDFLHFMVQVGDFTVFVRGSIDVLVAPDLIEDHKTTINTKYAKSPLRLAESNQPLIYGHFLLLKLMDEGKEFPERIQITHNYFVKDPLKPRVKKVVAKYPNQEPGVTPDMIETRWAQLTTIAQEMAQLTRVENWRDTPDPPSFGKACNAYGGCPYRSICGGRETPEHYTKRVELTKEKENVTNSVLSKNLAAAKGGSNVPPAGPVTVNGTVPPKPAAAPAKLPPRPAAAPPKAAAPAKKKDERTFFVLDPATGEPFEGEKTFDEVYGMIGEIKQDLQLNQSGTPDWKPASEVGGFEVVLTVIGGAETPEAPKPEAPKPEAKTPPANQRTAPWWSAKCKACELNVIKGFNSKGNVCRTCESHFGKVVAQSYKIVADEKGEISWTEIAVETAAPEAPAPEAPAAETPAAPETTEGEETPESAIGSSGDKTIADALAPAKRGRGRPSKGFTLLIGISCSKGFPNTIQLDDFLATYGRELAKVSATPENGVESYYDLDPFQRRDKLARAADKIAKEFGTAFVVANGTDPDTRALIAAVRPYASTVFERVAS